MACIYFVGTYNPIMCGIADYTGFLTRESPAGKWGVISFDLEKYGDPLVTGNGLGIGPVWYGIPGRHDVSAPIIREGLAQLNAPITQTVLWFQHENAIWANLDNFIETLRHLTLPKVITFHSLHFQCAETSSGLKTDQRDLLRKLLPHINAITVFSHGVYYAVTSAFPEYREKVYVLKHGVQRNPEIAHLSRREAKQRLLDFLLYESDLDLTVREAIHHQRVLTDDATFVLGETGFLCPGRQSERLYLIRDILSQMTPGRNIVALRIGGIREEIQKAYAIKLREYCDNRNKFLLEMWLPEHMLAVAQRAFDLNFYWPQSCTQSGAIAHALGAGAVIAGRDMEGTGEMLKESGQLVDANLHHLAEQIRRLVLHPNQRERMERAALQYAERFSWKNQAFLHYDIASRILRPVPRWLPTSPVQATPHLDPTAARQYTDDLE